LDDGRLEFRSDVYHRDAELMAALKAQQSMIITTLFTEKHPAIL
jgi:murein L,D-transpeptidase YcbB/YkuD